MPGRLSITRRSERSGTGIRARQKLWQKSGKGGTDMSGSLLTCSICCFSPHGGQRTCLQMLAVCRHEMCLWRLLQTRMENVSQMRRNSVGLVCDCKLVTAIMVLKCTVCAVYGHVHAVYEVYQLQLLLCELVSTQHFELLVWNSFESALHWISN